MGTDSTALRPKRARLFYLDLIRALATFLIVLTHFNNPFFSEGGYLLTNRPFNIYVGDLGVSLFLIISGSALAYTYSSPLDLKAFYWKRFKGIYPMFWTAWVLGTLFFFIDSKGHPMNAGPASSIIWTVFGIDGLVANFHVPTVYLLGEWFLGFIIVFYLVFPLLLHCIERRPVWTAGALAVLYAATLLLGPHISAPLSVIITTRLPELAFGVYLIRYLPKTPKLLALPALLVLICFAVFGEGVNKDLATTAVGISAFVVLVAAADLIAIRPVRALVGLVAKYSYPIFLVHHVIIYKLFMFSDIPWREFGRAQTVVFFAAVCVLTLGIAIALDRLTARIVAFVGDAWSGSWWTTKPLPAEDRAPEQISGGAR